MFFVLRIVDQSRVKLPCADDDPSQGYINASYMPVCTVLLLSIYSIIRKLACFILN